MRHEVGRRVATRQVGMTDLLEIPGSPLAEISGTPGGVLPNVTFVQPEAKLLKMVET